MFFRNRKKYGDVEGYDRISRLIEDRQAGAEPAEDELFEEEDTVLLTREPREGAAAREPVAARDGAAEVEELVEESVTVVRAPERPAPRQAQPSVTPVPAPAVSFAPPAPAMETPRMPAPDLSVGASQAGAVSLVAKDAVWEGKLTCGGNVRIEGTLHGEVETTATLFVAADARVDGTVRARNVTLAGEIQGNLHCQERLEILPGGAARGEVDTGTLVVHEGAFIDSRFQMRREAATG